MARMPLCLLFLRAGITHLIRKTHNKHMNVARAQYLFLVLVSFLLGVTTVHAADAASPIGFWQRADGIFEMSENERRPSAKIVALGEPNTAEGTEKNRYLQSGSDQTRSSDHRTGFYICPYEEECHSLGEWPGL
jgi:hypothetical protein